MKEEITLPRSWFERLLELSKDIEERVNGARQGVSSPQQTSEKFDSLIGYINSVEEILKQ
jgi:hypothetical protein